MSLRLLFFAVLLGVSLSASAVRYPVDSEPRINNLVNILTVQHQQLQKLLDMSARLDDWKMQLDDENKRLAKEGQLAKSDRLMFEEGKLSENDLNKKWHLSGRSAQHERELNMFEQEVSEFNAYVRQYNKLSNTMSTVLSSRSQSDVRELITEMRKLITILQQALQDGNLEKARFIAKQSVIASEFGYTH